MAPDNTIKAANNIDIYEHKIYSLFDEYKETLSDNEKDCDIMIRNVRYFKGALKHIYLNLFKPASCYDSTYNRYVTSILDYDDYNTLDYLWSIYTSLCYKYGIKPTVMNYSLMTGIEAETITNWSARLSDSFVGDMFQGNQDNKSRYSKDTQVIKGKLAKNWLKEQESALFDGASSGSVGDIFLLKALYNYRDNTNITIDNNTSAEERHAIESDLIKRLTTAPESDIQSSQEREAMTITTSTPPPDF